MGRTDAGECERLHEEDTSLPLDSVPPEETGEDTSEGDPDPDPEPILEVYLLAGQSNMDGGGLVSGLAPSMQVATEQIPLFWSGRWAWRGLSPSSYWGVNYFGPEVSFGHRLAELDSEQPIALIKHAVGGTNLAECWFPGEDSQDSNQGSCYSGFIATVDAALGELEASETPYQVSGMAWMQGESDATYLEWANAYEGNLTHFLSRVREDLSTPGLPFVMGRIDCTVHCPFRDTVRAAQDKVAEDVPKVSVVETEDLPQVADALHFDASGMRTLGERFADVLSGRGERDTAVPATRLSGSYQSVYTGNFVVGYAFETDRPLVITDVGTLDIGMDGLAQGATVALWEEATGTLLVQHGLPSRSSMQTSLNGHWRFGGIEPYELPAGRYVIGSQVYFQSEDRYIHHAAVEFQDGIEWIEGRHSNGTDLNFPTQVTAAEASWFGPSFLFEEVEEEKEVP